MGKSWLPYAPRFCERCGEPLNRLDEQGNEIIMRCDCDWERGFQSRCRKTVHEDYFYKTMADWNPSIFSESRAGDFPNLIKVQKFFLMVRLNDFWFKPMSEEGKRALHASIHGNKNLYIRGPAHSGRGLILSSMKMLAAVREISTTPLPGDFKFLKSEAVGAEAYGPAGNEAKAKVAEKYENVSFLALEGVSGESILKYNGERQSQKFRGRMTIDRIMANRMTKPGAMALAGPEFLGEIADSLGDGLRDVMASGRTAIVILFEPIEANSLLAGLRSREADLVREVNTLKAPMAEKKKGKSQPDTMLTNAISQEKMAVLWDYLFFKEAFGNIPAKGIKAPDEDVIGDLKTGGFPPEVYKEYEKFLEQRERGKNCLEYQEGLKRARYDGASRCKMLASKMSEKELLETGKMLEMACSDKAKIDEIVAKTSILQKQIDPPIREGPVLQQDD